MSHIVNRKCIIVATYTYIFFSAGKAQGFLGSLFALLDEKWVSVGSVVLKRKQGLSDEQAAAGEGTIVDLVPTKLEGFGMKLMLKRIASATDKQVYFCADHDMQVNKLSALLSAQTSRCHQHHFVTNITLSPKSRCHQNHVVTNITLSPTSLQHFFIKWAP